MKPIARSGSLIYDHDCGICLATASWLAKRVQPPRRGLLAIAADHSVAYLLLEPLYREVAANRGRIGRALQLPVSCPLPGRNQGED
jgi:hypothetical protein